MPGQTKTLGVMMLNRHPQILKSFMVCALTLFLLGGCGNGSSDGKIKMKVSIGVPESHFEYQAMVKFKEHLAKHTTIDVEIYPSNQLGADQEALESMRLGAIQMNLPDPAVLGNMVPEFNLLSFPFLFETQDVAAKVVDGKWGQDLLEKLDKAGYVGLGYGDFGFRHITNSKRPIETVADLKGLKIRTMQNPVHLDVFRKLGANPTPMSFKEVFSSLQQGVIDGQENPLKNIESNKLYEVQKYLTLDGHVFSFVVFVVSKKFFDKLEPAHQEAMREAARIATAHMREGVQKEDAAALKIIKDEGIDVRVLADGEKEKMTAMVADIKAEYAAKINPEFYAELKAAIKAAQAEK
jgi:tripartite ATP-independent transporter DctP family solute receptor